MDELLELKSRREIFLWLVDNPGAHQREIQRALDLGTGQLSYHLKILVDNDLLVMTKDGNYSRYFPKFEFTKEEKKILSFLRRELSRGIMIWIMMNSDVSQQDLAERFKVSKPTINYHISKMVGEGLLDQKRVGREIRYNIKNEKLVSKMIVAYQKSFFDKLVDSFVRAFSDVKK